MSKLVNSIFRKRAVERYKEGRSEAAPPPLVAPRVYPYLLAVCALLACSALLIGTMSFPDYAQASAAVVEGKGKFGGVADELVVLVFVPAAYGPSMRAGRKVYFKPGGQDVEMSGEVVAVEPQTINLRDAAARYALAGGLPSESNEPVVVAVARLEPPPAGLLPSLRVGGTFEAKVEVGSRRLYSHIPVVGRFLEK